MKIKEIYVEAKKSRSFQTYTSGMLIDVSGHTDEEIDTIRGQMQAKCRKACVEQIKIDSLK